MGIPAGLLFMMLSNKTYALLLTGGLFLAGAVGGGIWLCSDEAPAGGPSANLEKTPAVVREDTDPDRSDMTAGPLPLEDPSGGDDEEDADPEVVMDSPAQPPPLESLLSGGRRDDSARIREVQALRGSGFSEADRKAALEFLAGSKLPVRTGKGAIQWLADELLTALRLQEPPWPEMAE
jgi:hypothetical protein